MPRKLKIEDQPATYYPYARGLGPEELPLGALLSDPAQPSADIFRELNIAEEDMKPHIRPFVDEEEKTTFVFGACTEHEVHGDLGKFAKAGARAEKADAFVQKAPKKSVRVELNKPLSFLTDLRADNAKVDVWLRARLMKKSGAYAFKRATFQHPEIWLVTGIHYSTDVEIDSLAVHSVDVHADISARSPDPLSAGTSAIGGEASIGAGGQISNSYLSSYSSTLKGKRVWAAQFQQLDLQYMRQKKLDEKLPQEIMLHKVQNVRGGRRGQGKSHPEQIKDEKAVNTNDTGDEVVEDLAELWTISLKESKSCHYIR